jgi:hypothetical protein
VASMNWAGCTKEEIETRLLALMAACRARYEVVSAIQADLQARVRDVDPASGAGILAAAKAATGAKDLLKVGSDYQKTLKQFTDFTVDGKIPDD